MTPFTPVSEVGEFGLIDRLADVLDTPPGDDLIRGIGDDAAVYRIGHGRVHVVTTDMLVEGVHFDRVFMPLGHLGFKVLAVNVSDVVAMNAEPRYATVAIGLPNNVSVEQAETIYEGIGEAARRFGVMVAGGDVSAAERLVISVTVIGEAAEDDVVFRSGAQPGDALCVTGDLGAAAAGLKVLLAEKETFLDSDRQPDLREWAYVVERHLAPQARLDRIRQWREAGFKPHALIDISDGLASEAHHICRASGVGARLEAGLFPVHVDTVRAAERFGDPPEHYALFGGEDYELLFAAPESMLAVLPSDSFAIVGHVTSDEGEVLLQQPDGEVVRIQPQGYRHF